MKVHNIAGVANQFIIETKEDIVFQSYDTVIAVINKLDKSISLDVDYYNYSKTTLKYLYIFLDTTNKQFKKDLLIGKYKLVKSLGDLTW
jgi:hypothetical protein